MASYKRCRLAIHQMQVRKLSLSFCWLEHRVRDCFDLHHWTLLHFFAYIRRKRCDVKSTNSNEDDDVISTPSSTHPEHISKLLKERFHSTGAAAFVSALLTRNYLLSIYHNTSNIMLKLKQKHMIREYVFPHDFTWIKIYGTNSSVIELTGTFLSLLIKWFIGASQLTTLNSWQLEMMLLQQRHFIKRLIKSNFN